MWRHVEEACGVQTKNRQKKRYMLYQHSAEILPEAMASMDNAGGELIASYDALSLPKVFLESVPGDIIQTVQAFSRSHPGTHDKDWLSGLFSPLELANIAVRMRESLMKAGNVDAVT